MEEDTKKLLLNGLIILNIILIIGIIVFFFVLNSSMSSKYEISTNTNVISSSDDLIKLIEEGKYEEASYLADAIDSQWKFINSAYGGPFYEDMQNISMYDRYSIISADLNVFENCSKHNVPQEICDNLEKIMIKDIKSIQKNLCERSYFSEDNTFGVETENLKRRIGDIIIEENITANQRC